MTGKFRLCFWVSLILIILWPADGVADETKRVLVLHSYGPYFSPFNAFSNQFRAHLISRSPSTLDIYEASLESARTLDTGSEPAFVDYLKALFVERPPDLVVPIGGAASQFAQKWRDRLFPNTPLLITGMEQRRLKADALSAKDAAVAFRLDLPAAVENILQILPGTKRIFVVLGNSPLEQFWAQAVTEVLRRFDDRLTFELSTGLPYSEVLRRAAALPAGTVVLYGMMAVDAKGATFEEDRALIMLRAISAAPVFGLFDSQIGRGIVGGPLLSVDDLASRAADEALRMLRGGPSDPGNVSSLGFASPTFDWRELHRWGISEANLPPTSRILFREVTPWEKYRWPIIGVILLCLVQAAFIVALLEHRRRLRRTKSDLRVSDERLGLAAGTIGLGFWIWDIAKDDVWMTDSGRKLFRWPNSGKVSFEFLVEAAHPEDRALFRRWIQRMLDGTGDFELEHRLATAGHPVQWVASRGHAEFDLQGRPAYVRGVTIEITKRHEAEEAARELSGRLINVHEDERSRLARELHDDITQRLAVLAIDAARGERNAATPSDGAAMQRIRVGLARLSEDVHSLSYRLHPSILEDLGLADALQAECDHFSKLERIPVEVDVGDTPVSLEPTVALCLFRVTQEALRNIGRHAAATRVQVSVRQEGRRLQISITDDGKGFDWERQRIKPSLGLASMRQRMELVGGKLTVQTVERHGTTVLGWVPLQEVEIESTARAFG
jgi:signal transduction histidine kinase